MSVIQYIQFVLKIFVPIKHDASGKVNNYLTEKLHNYKFVPNMIV